MDKRDTIIIALGQPSDPQPHVAALRDIAESVAGLLPGWNVRGAALEAPDSVKAAADGLDRPLVYPLFLANGFFMTQVLPRKLAGLVPGAEILPPFGADPRLPALVSNVVAQALREHRFAAAETSLLLAAHGSEAFPASRLSTGQLVREVAARAGLRKAVAGFLQERPFIAESARDLGQAICLPVFALRANHVAVDIPRALQKACFTGPTLAPLGMQPEVPAFIAAALRQHALGQAA